MSCSELSCSPNYGFGPGLSGGLTTFLRSHLRFSFLCLAQLPKVQAAAAGNQCFKVMDRYDCGLRYGSEVLCLRDVMPSARCVGARRCIARWLALLTTLCQLSTSCEQDNRFHVDGVAPPFRGVACIGCSALCRYNKRHRVGVPRSKAGDLG